MGLCGFCVGAHVGLYTVCVCEEMVQCAHVGTQVIVYFGSLVVSVASGYRGYAVHFSIGGIGWCGGGYAV